jgi:hypothetical protein
MSDDFVMLDIRRQIMRDAIDPAKRPRHVQASYGLAAGTQVMTIEGPVAVEDITPGDVLVTTGSTGNGMRGVVLNTRHHFMVSRHVSAEHARPVKIRAGALGPDVPERDLRLSPTHEINLDGSWYPAKLLVNGTTIVHEIFSGPMVYHQIELERPDIILAENTPVASAQPVSSKTQSGIA